MELITWVKFWNCPRGATAPRAFLSFCALIRGRCLLEGGAYLEIELKSLVYILFHSISSGLVDLRYWVRLFYFWICAFKRIASSPFKLSNCTRSSKFHERIIRISASLGMRRLLFFLSFCYKCGAYSREALNRVNTVYDSRSHLFDLDLGCKTLRKLIE